MRFSIFLVASLLLLMALPAQAKVDKFWNSVDTFFRGNIPDPTLKRALVDAELVDVHPTAEAIHFTYQLTDGSEARIQFQMTPEGNIAGVSGEIIKPDLEESATEISQQVLVDLVFRLYKGKLAPEDLKKASVEPTVNGFKYELIYSLNEDSSITYSVICQSDAKGEISIIKNQYLSLPPLNMKHLHILTPKDLSAHPINKAFLEDFAKIYPGVALNTIISVSASLPYYAVAFQASGDSASYQTLLVVEYDFIGHTMYEIARETTETGKLENKDAVIEVEVQDTTQDEVLSQNDQAIISGNVIDLQTPAGSQISLLEPTTDEIQEPEQLFIIEEREPILAELVPDEDSSAQNDQQIQSTESTDTAESSEDGQQIQIVHILEEDPAQQNTDNIPEIHIVHIQGDEPQQQDTIIPAAQVDGINIQHTEVKDQKKEETVLEQQGQDLQEEESDKQEVDQDIEQPDQVQDVEKESQLGNEDNAELESTSQGPIEEIEEPQLVQAAPAVVQLIDQSPISEVAGVEPETIQQPVVLEESIIPQSVLDVPILISEPLPVDNDLDQPVQWAVVQQIPTDDEPIIQNPEEVLIQVEQPIIESEQQQPFENTEEESAEPIIEEEELPSEIVVEEPVIDESLAEEAGIEQNLDQPPVDTIEIATPKEDNEASEVNPVHEDFQEVPDANNELDPESENTVEVVEPILQTNEPEQPPEDIASEEGQEEQDSQVQIIQLELLPNSNNIRKQPQESTEYNEPQQTEQTEESYEDVQEEADSDVLPIQLEAEEQALSGQAHSMVVEHQSVITRVKHDRQGDHRGDNCLRFNRNRCIRCANRYFLDDSGFCQKVQDECIEYHPYTGECYECYQGYILSFGNCISFDPLCSQADPQGQCVKCYKGYVLSEGKCYRMTGHGHGHGHGADLQVVPLCIEADEEGNCVKCEKGTYLRHGACEIIDPECESFNHETGECEVCRRGFTPFGARCERMW